MVIESGNNLNSKYIAYGDDSVFKEILVYGFIIVKREKKSSLEKDVFNLKKEFGIPKDIPIHMRNLISGQYRDKHNIKKLNKDRIPIFIRKFVNVLNKNDCFIRYCYTKVPESGKLLPENSPDDEIKIIENHKAILHQMAGACFTPYIQENVTLFTANDFEVYISYNDEKVKIAENTPRRQAHYLSEMLVPLSNPAHPDSYIRLKPHIQLMKDNILLQAADVIVYMLAHSLCKDCDGNMFQYHINRVKSWIRDKFVTEANQEEMGAKLPTDNE